uniref:Uncharacterized protein n=1 Tax=Acrobeloides nanus TaxID=290746 RepID=A0A914CCM9_9BILA
MVDHILNSNIIHDYETTVRKLTAILRRTRYEQVPRIFDYTHHNISLREFEAFYRDGGKDNQALHEILKCRKTVQTDVIDAINDLTHKINNALTARIAFYKAIGISPPANEAIAQTHQIVGCLQRLVPKIHVLKKATFLKAEWMSRLQREVTIAQSYSPGPQYDKVNLLFLKIYFAHFKQELIVQERSYNLFLLLAEIGGTIGLYVGATLLTVAETVVFFFEKNTRNFNSYIANHHVDV